MRIIHLVENLDDSYGGPARSIPLLCKYLNNLDVENYILSIRYKANEKNSVVDSDGIKWESFDYKFWKKIRYSKTLKERLTQLLVVGNTIVHVHNSWNYIPFLAYTVCKMKSIPLVVSVRGSMYPWSLKQSKWKKKISWIMFQRKVLESASFVHVTEPNEMKAVRALGVKNSIALIPNGIEVFERDVEQQEETSIQIQLNENRRYMLFMSRIHPKKGLDLLFDAWVPLANKYADWDLLLAGPVEDKAYFKLIVDKVGKGALRDRVHFLGAIEGREKRSIFKISELFVLPSHTENFGIVIAEALNNGLPVITTNGTPWKEIEDYDCGWYIAPSVSGLNMALREAFELSTENLATKGKRSSKFIRNYDWKLQAEKMHCAYSYIFNSQIKPQTIYEFGT